MTPPGGLLGFGRVDKAHRQTDVQRGFSRPALTCSISRNKGGRCVADDINAVPEMSKASVHGRQTSGGVVFLRPVRWFPCCPQAHRFAAQAVQTFTGNAHQGHVRIRENGRFAAHASSPACTARGCIRTDETNSKSRWYESCGARSARHREASHGLRLVIDNGETLVFNILRRQIPGRCS
jgi:hypothetical protein